MSQDYEIPAHLTEYGFQYGAAKIERLHSDPKDGSVLLSLTTPKTGTGNMMQIRVTRTGKIRVFHDGEWTR